MRKTVLFMMICAAVLGTTPLLAGPRQTESVDAGVEMSHITYKEPGIMKQTGIMYGVHAAYEDHDGPSYWKIEGKLSYGQVDYTGSLSSGTPHTFNNINDYLIEMRGLKGLQGGESPSPLQPYIGLGYRYLYDGSDKDIYGYRRESNYIYVPIGLERRPEMNPGWSFGAVIEYDLFLWGKQISHLSDVNPGYSDAQNSQSTGYGVRGSLLFYRKGAENDVIIEPFVRYWNIKESEVDLVTFNGSPYTYLVEPDNNSTEIGIKFRMRF